MTAPSSHSAAHHGLLLLSCCCLLLTLLSPASALVVLRDTDEAINNCDFWFMPNDYDVTSTLVRARFLKDEECKMDTTVNAAGRVLYVSITDFEDAGCYYFDQTIAAVTEMGPLVTIYASHLYISDIGYLTAELYGQLDSYADSGLALTLVNEGGAAMLEEALEAGGPVNISVSADVGPWIRFADSAHLKAYMAVFDIAYGVVLLYCLVRLGMFIKQGNIKLTIPVYLFFSCSLFCILRILDLSVNPLYLRNNTAPWVRFLFFWMGYVFGYGVFVLIGVSWILMGRHLNISGWLKKVTVHLIRFSYFGWIHLAIVAILNVASMAYPGNHAMAILRSASFYSVIPFLAIEALILAGFGVQIVYKLQKSMAGNTSRSKLAYRKISILLISSVCGLFVIAASIVISQSRNNNIPNKMALDWVKEIASLWMVVSILFALTLQSGPVTTKKGTESLPGTGGHTTTTEKTDLQMDFD